MHYYDIYGFVIAVDDPVRKAFDKEYWRFKTSKNKADLYVRLDNSREKNTYLREATQGINLPFREGENTVYYDKGIDPEYLLYAIEPFIHWKDKTFLHCGAVSKNGNSVLFVGKGGVGKTSMVLFLSKKGYEYLSDDWAIVGNNKIYPFFKTVHVFDYNLKNKDLARRALGLKRFYYRFIFAIFDLIDFIFRHRFVRIATRRIRPIFSVDIAKLYPEAKLGSISDIAYVFLLEQANIAEPKIEKINPDLIANKMIYVNLTEMNPFYKEYYEYAFTHGKNSWMENRKNTELKIMKESFKKAKTYRIHTPKKIKPEKIYETISRVISKDGN